MGTNGLDKAIQFAMCNVSHTRARQLQRRMLMFRKEKRACKIPPPNEIENTAIVSVWAHLSGSTSEFDALDRIVMAWRMERFQMIMARLRYWQRMVAEYDADMMPYSYTATILRLRRFATLLWNWIDTQSDPEPLWRELAESAPDAFVNELDVNSIQFYYGK